jgi:hypothetical protein
LLKRIQTKNVSIELTALGADDELPPFPTLFSFPIISTRAMLIYLYLKKREISLASKPEENAQLLV